MEILDEQPKGKQDFDQWISNGVILSKGTYICHISGRQNYIYTYIIYTNSEIQRNLNINIKKIVDILFFFSSSTFYVQLYSHGNDPS